MKKGDSFLDHRVYRLATLLLLYTLCPQENVHLFIFQIILSKINQF